jgi:putative phage-type endonuclease
MNAMLAPHLSATRGYIGGGNIAGILGVSPYKSPLDEYLTITGGEDPITEDQRRFFARRKALEPFAVDLFLDEVKGREVARVNHRYTDPEFPFIQAEIDAETDDAENIEIKSVHPLAAGDWGHADSDDIPVYVTAQAMHGLMVTDRKVCFPIAMIGFDDFRVYRIERDEETIKAMRARELEFWHKHVVPMNPPEAVTPDDVRRLYLFDSGTTVEADAEALAAINRLRDLKAQIKPLEQEFDDLKHQVQLYMRSCAVIHHDGKPLATWKTQTARRFDQSKFAEVHPALFEQFKSASESRVFRLK